MTLDELIKDLTELKEKGVPGNSDVTVTGFAADDIVVIDVHHSKELGYATIELIGDNADYIDSE